MKTRLNSLLLTAAGLTLGVAAAYGQDKIIANVPFEFRTASGIQAAGLYSIAQAGVTTTLVNQATGATSLLGIGTPEDANTKAIPKLVFVCGSESGCALTSVTLADGRSWSFKAPHLKPAETARIAVVHFESRQTE
ncbi:MAG TPA: hypothetical protein VKV74_11930 [Bryobacteraceae bacterium]|nr:hypothetical protein [Bryobacteraceae bacterium]